jgi:hypothetical protein
MDMILAHGWTISLGFFAIMDCPSEYGKIKFPAVTEEDVQDSDRLAVLVKALILKLSHKLSHEKYKAHPCQTWK